MTRSFSGANTLAIFYNKKVLEKAGVEPPKTWDELKTTAKKLTVDKQYGFAFDGTADDARQPERRAGGRAFHDAAGDVGDDRGCSLEEPADVAE